MIASLLTIALMPRVGDVLATRSAGWLAAAMLALSPVHIWYAQEARAYSLIMLGSVLLPLAYHALERDAESRWNKIHFILLCVALAQLHYYAVVLPGVYVLVSLVRRRHLKTSVLALALSGLCVAAVIGAKWRLGELTTESSYLGVFDWTAAHDLFVRWFLLGGSVSFDPSETNPPGTTALGILLVISALTAVALWATRAIRKPRSVRSLELALLLVAIPGLMLLLNWIGKERYYIERSAIPSLPYFALAVGAGIDRLAKRGFRAGLTGALVAGMVGVLVAFHSKSDKWTVYKPNADWRGAAELLKHELDAKGAPIVVLGTTPLTELRYYMSGTAECEWPPVPSPAARQPVSGIRGVIARRFPTTRQPSCGPTGSARVRTYVVGNSSTQWARDVFAFEAGARPAIALNDYWLGYTRFLLNNLLAGSALGIELAYIVRRVPTVSATSRAAPPQ